MRFTSTAVAAAVALVTWGSAATAKEVGVATLAPARGPIAADRVELAVSRAVTGQGDQAIVRPAGVARERVAAGVVRRERLVPFRRARELLDQGWRAYAQVRTEEARGKLLEARRRALEVADLAGGVRLLAEISLRLGVIELELGNPSGAAAEFRMAQRLAPQRAVTINQFKPQVVSAFRAAVAAPSEPREVTLRRSSEQVSVEIDGRPLPWRGGAIELDAGLHLVVGRQAGRDASRALVAVGDKQKTVEVNPPADADAGPLAHSRLVAGQKADAATRLAAAIALYAELDDLVLVAAVWRGGQPALVGQLCSGAPLQCSRVLELRFTDQRGLGASASELIERLRREPRRRPLTLPSDRRVARPEGPGGSDRPPVVERPWWKNPWLWVGVGAAALAGGAAAVFSGGGDDRSVVIQVPDPCEFGGCP